MRAPAAAGDAAVVGFFLAKNLHRCSVARVGPWLAGVVRTSDSEAINFEVCEEAGWLRKLATF